jgi:toxin secretion/phage lysis holin
MKEFWIVIQFFFTGIGGWLGDFLGGWDGLLMALVVFVVMDYVTGIMCAVADRSFVGEVGFKGICRRLLIFMLVGIGNVLDVHIIGTGAVVRTAVILFYLGKEGISLLENATHIGLPVPKKLKQVLGQLHQTDDETGEDKAAGDGDEAEAEAKEAGTDAEETSGNPGEDEVVSSDDEVGYVK